MPRHFDHWLKEYTDFARDSEAPVKFHFWTGVSTVAGALRRRVWLDMHKFQWTPNFYVILVAPAGIVQKSTTIGTGMRLLEKVQGVRFGPESMTWQALGKALSESTEYVEFKNPVTSTLDRLAMSALTIGIGELGTFLRTDDDQLLSFLIRVWDGQCDTFRHETKSSGNIEVPNPWLNLLAATTPAWLRANFPEHLVGGGFTSRVVFVYGDQKRKLIPYPDEVIPPSEYHETERKLVEDLQHIAKLSGPYTLSPLARDWGRDWYERHNTPVGHAPYLASDRFAGYLARKQTHLHKFALVLAAAQRDEQVIHERDLEEAEQIINSTEPDMLRVFESIGVAQESRHITEICGFLRPSGLPMRELWSSAMPFMSLMEFNSALRAATAAHMIITYKRDGEEFVSLIPKPTKDTLQ